MKHAKDAILRSEQANYLEALEPPRDELLRALEESARERGLPISDPEVCSFLATVARSTEARRIVELGTNIGYGAIVLARAAGPLAHVITVEKNEALAAEARRNVVAAGLEERIEVRVGDAVAFLESHNEPVDLAYVDCVKEDYPTYLKRLVPMLVSGGVLIADNVLWRGLVAAETVPDSERAKVEALRTFNHDLVNHPKLRAVVLPLGDGVAFATKLGSPSMLPPAPVTLPPR